MSDLLDFPPIEAPTGANPTFTGKLVPAAAALPMTLTAAAVAPFEAVRADMLALAKRYERVEFDVSTKAGLDEAKKARLDLRENGRFRVQRAGDQFKKDANKAKSAVDAIADELVAIVRPEEDRIHAIITKREEQIEAERQERAIAEAARVKKHRDAIERIVGFERHAQGLPAERIAVGIGMLEAVSTGPEFEEFEAEATKVKADTLTAMRALHARVVVAEREAAELAALRAEKARRDEADRIAAMTSAAAAMPPLPPERVIQIMQSLGGDNQNIEARDSQQVLKAEPATADATDRDAPAMASPVGGPMGAGQAAAAAPAGEPADTRPPINLTEIARRLGFPLTRAFIEDTLGIAPSMTVKASVLWPGSAWASIKAKLGKHIEGCE